MLQGHPRRYRRTPRSLISLSLLSAFVPACMAQAQDSTRELRWTGPLVSSAPPLPQGVLNVEPYLIQTQVVGNYDEHSRRRGIDAAADDWQLALPIQYGVSDRFNLGVVLNALHARQQRGGAYWASGDSSLSASWLLASGSGENPAALTVALKQNLPTGRHDKLDQAGLLSATGTGALSTTVGIYGQQFFLAQDTLRGRINLNWRLPGARVRVDGRSGYGTVPGFHGKAVLGAAMQASASLEYSLDTRWVLAGDLVYEKENGAHVRGDVHTQGQALHPADVDLPSSWRVSVAPAVEYNWSPNAGVIVGALVSLDGRNSAAIVQPQVAINLAF